MGHREDLFEGAKRCLLEKGYARTTARDIVAASGANLASIGYHFGSKEALLNAAAVAVINDWGDTLEAGLAPEESPDATPLDRLQTFLERVTGSFTDEHGPWAASVELFVEAQRIPELRAGVADGIEKARGEWAYLFQDVDPEKEPEKARQLGSLYYSLLAGLVLQHMLDPERAPTAHDVTEALRSLAATT